MLTIDALALLLSLFCVQGPLSAALLLRLVSKDWRDTVSSSSSIMGNLLVDEGRVLETLNEFEFALRCIRMGPWKVRCKYSVYTARIQNDRALRTCIGDLTLCCNDNVFDGAVLKGCTAKTLTLSGTTVVELVTLPYMEDVTTVNLDACTNLKQLDGIEKIPNATVVSISGCGIRDVYPLEKLPRMKSLILSTMKGINPTNLDGCRGLTRLTLMLLTIFEGIIVLPPRLEGVTIFGCHKVENLDGFSSTEASPLTKVHIEFCRNLANCNNVIAFPCVEEVNITHCKNFRDVAGLALLQFCAWLTISNCDALTDIAALSSALSLKEFNVSGCESLSMVDAVLQMPGLEKFTAVGCPHIITQRQLEQDLENENQVEVKFRPKNKDRRIS